jgi:hypothetical protein
MIDEFPARIKQFNEVVHDAQILISIARDSDLQRKSIATLSDFSVSLRDWKQEAITAKNEDRANLILGMECLVEALKAELSMWLSLKAEKPENAWENLIAAQTATSDAVRAHTTFANLENHAKYLDAIERVVFPPQIFLSAGMIVHKQICSICDLDYEDCHHVVGVPYWGKFCFRTLKDVVLDHVSIVTDPANKLCRMTHFSIEGGRRNRMTWQVETAKDQEQPTGDHKSLTTTGSILARDLVS